MGGQNQPIRLWVVYNHSTLHALWYTILLYVHNKGILGDEGWGGQNQLDMWVLLLVACQWMPCKEAGTNPGVRTSDFLIFIPHMTQQCIGGECLGTNPTAEQSRVLFIHRKQHLIFKGDFWGQTRPYNSLARADEQTDQVKCLDWRSWLAILPTWPQEVFGKKYAFSNQTPSFLPSLLTEALLMRPQPWLASH